MPSTRTRARSSTCERRHHREITATGIRTRGRATRLDVILFATGFDAMTGAMHHVDITRPGSRWPRSGITGPPKARAPTSGSASGVPEPVHDHRPGQPVGAHQHGREQSSSTSNRSPTASRTCANADTRRSKPDRSAGRPGRPSSRSPAAHDATCNSWYLGANVPGKTRVFMPLPGFPTYVEQRAKVAEEGYWGPCSPVARHTHGPGRRCRLVAAGWLGGTGAGRRGDKMDRGRDRAGSRPGRRGRRRRRRTARTATAPAAAGRRR